MDEDGNVKTATLVIGVAVFLALIIGGGLVADAFLPRLFPWAGIPALIFGYIYIAVHRHRAKSKR